MTQKCIAGALALSWLTFTPACGLNPDGEPEPTVWGFVFENAFNYETISPIGTCTFNQETRGLTQPELVLYRLSGAVEVPCEGSCGAARDIVIATIEEADSRWLMATANANRQAFVSNIMHRDDLRPVHSRAAKAMWQVLGSAACPYDVVYGSDAPIMIYPENGGVTVATPAEAQPTSFKPEGLFDENGVIGTAG